MLSASLNKTFSSYLIIIRPCWANGQTIIYWICRHRWQLPVMYNVYSAITETWWPIQPTGLRKLIAYVQTHVNESFIICTLLRKLIAYVHSTDTCRRAIHHMHLIKVIDWLCTDTCNSSYAQIIPAVLIFVVVFMKLILSLYPFIFVFF